MLGRNTKIDEQSKDEILKKNENKKNIANMLFVVIISIIIFVVYQLNRHQICLSRGFDYNEKVNNILNGIIEGQIDSDKKKRIYWMKNNDYEANEIDRKILFLEDRYEKERVKIFKYCQVDEISFFDYYAGYNYQYKNCSISHHWRDKGGADFMRLNYKLDIESSQLFNEVLEFYSKSSISPHDRVDNIGWYKKSKLGLISDNIMFLDCYHIGYSPGPNYNTDEIIIPFTKSINEINAHKYNMYGDKK